MQKNPFPALFLQTRSLWYYYALFFSGCLVLVYQALDWTVAGDSFTFMCLLFAGFSLGAKRPLHIAENSVLLTAGYILPLLIRNSIKMQSAEGPPMQDFLGLAVLSSSTTLAIGFACTCCGFIVLSASRRLARSSRGKVTIRK